MPISDETRAKFEAIVEELALSINDAIVATTAQQKLAAKNRFKEAMKQHGLLVLRSVLSGVQNDY